MAKLLCAWGRERAISKESLCSLGQPLRSLVIAWSRLMCAGKLRRCGEGCIGLWSAATWAVVGQSPIYVVLQILSSPNNPSFFHSYTLPVMPYDKVDELAINTIRTLAVRSCPRSGDPAIALFSQHLNPLTYAHRSMLRVRRTRATLARPWEWPQSLTSCSTSS